MSSLALVLGLTSGISQWNRSFVKVPFRSKAFLTIVFFLRVPEDSEQCESLIPMHGVSQEDGAS